MDANEFGLPTEADVFEEIAKSEQQIKVGTLIRRYGKKTTTVQGFDKHTDVKAIGKRLKEELACGGTVKNGIVELQGEHKKKIVPLLEEMGFSNIAVSE